jgi:hypothetical protein
VDNEKHLKEFEVYRKKHRREREYQNEWGFIESGV